MRFLVFTLSILALTGCSSSLDLLRRLNPPADNFTSTLASEYLGYADSESEQGRGGAAEYYASKGLRASRGQVVEPDAIPDSLKTSDRDALTDARAVLMVLLNEDMKRIAVQKLARAQLLFDCWQYQVSTHVQPEQALCAGEFQTAIAELRDISDLLVYTHEAKHYLIFSPDSITLDEDARTLIRGIAREVNHTTGFALEMKRHEGRAEALMSLESRRIDAVRKALVAAGVPPRSIYIEAENDTQEVCIECNALEHDPDVVMLTVKTRTKKEVE